MLKDVVVQVRVAVRRSATSPPVCQVCECELDLHQPHPDRPDEMLGICRECAEWHILRYADDDASFSIARLPMKEIVGNKDRHAHSKSAQALQPNQNRSAREQVLANS